MFYYFSIPPRSGDLRNRFVFRGPIWMRMKDSGNFCVGQVPRTSHVATRPKKHVSDASVSRCHGLLQQASPQVCSWLFVEGNLHVIRNRYLDTHTCSWTTRYFFGPLFLRLVLPNKYSRIVCCCLLLPYFYYHVFRYFSRFFLCQSVCARTA